MSKLKKIKENNKTAPDIHAEIRGLGVLIEKVDNRVQNEVRDLGVFIKKVDERTQEEIRGLGALVEETRDEVRGVAEQYGDIKKTLDLHTEILDSHTEMIGNLTTDMAVVKGDISNLTTDMAVVKGDISNLTTDMAVVKENVVSIKDSVNRKVDVEEFTALHERVLVLEKRRT